MLLERMTFSDFDSVVRSKVSGAWNAHKALANVPVDFFIMLSSIAGIIGNRGQASYAAANTFLDSLVRHRRQLGLPAVAIDLPAMDDVGYLAENAERRSAVLKNLAGSTASKAELVALVATAVRGVNGQPCPAQILTGLHIADSLRPPFPIHDARFAGLINATETTGRPDQTKSESLQSLVAGSASLEQAEAAIINGLIEKITNLLLLAPGELQGSSSLTSYGLDSLSAIELRNWLTRELLAQLPMLEILTSGSIKSLASLTLRKSRIGLNFSI